MSVGFAHGALTTEPGSAGHQFALEDFCSSLFDDFFLTASPRKENVHRHMLWLLLHMQHRAAPSKVEALQKTLQPRGQSGEAVKELYSQLGEKLEQLDHRKPSPTQAAEPPALELPPPACLLQLGSQALHPRGCSRVEAPPGTVIRKRLSWPGECRQAEGPVLSGTLPPFSTA